MDEKFIYIRVIQIVRSCGEGNQKANKGEGSRSWQIGVNVLFEWPLTGDQNHKLNLSTNYSRLDEIASCCAFYVMRVAQILAFVEISFDDIFSCIYLKNWKIRCAWVPADPKKGLCLACYQPIFYCRTYLFWFHNIWRVCHLNMGSHGRF